MQVDLILQSLPGLFGQFVMNNHMNKLDYTLPELMNQLVSSEETLKSSRGSIFKNKKAEKPGEGMLVFESNLTVSSTSSWVLDYGSSAHICTSGSNSK